MPKVARTACRLPIDQATVELILAQKQAMRARYPDTPVKQLRLFPRMHRNPHGTIPMTPAHISRIMNLWVTAMPVIIDVDGSAFPREGIVAYAFRHSYAQRHADNGTPVEVLRELMGHASMVTTQGYYRVRQERAPQSGPDTRSVANRPPWPPDDARRPTALGERAATPRGRGRSRCRSACAPSRRTSRPGGRGASTATGASGCEHFRTDPSNQAELRGVPPPAADWPASRLATSIPQLADWAQRDAMPSEEGDLRAAGADPPQRPGHRRARARRSRDGARGDRDHPTAPRATTRHHPRPLQGRHPPASTDPSPTISTVARMSSRGEAMVVQRRLTSQIKHQRVIAALDAHLAAGRDLTSRRTRSARRDVSRKFIYAHPDLRIQIEQRAAQANQAGTARAVADGRVTIASLHADVANQKAQNGRLREQVRVLEQRVSAMLGAAGRRRDRPGRLRAPRPAARPAAAGVGTGVRARGDARRHAGGARRGA